MDRVKAYVDGFNLYHGLKHKHGRKYLWLDLEALVERLMKPAQTLVGWSTSPHALTAHSPAVAVVEGRFQEKTHRCRTCGARWTTHEEKETTSASP